MDPDEQAPRGDVSHEDRARPRRLGRAGRAAGRAVHSWRLLAAAMFVLAGALFVSSSLDSGGLDLRASSVTDLDTVVRQQRDRVDALQTRVAQLNREVTRLGENVGDARVTALRKQIEQLEGPAGFQAVHGPAVTVVLEDAPKEDITAAEEGGEVSADQLVVHQQDIQAVVNALWSGGAEAMTLQGQRVVSTTGIKCVGNTVVLHGIPYAPPYVITAVGDTSALLAALDASDYIAGYKTYVEAYNLGYEVRTAADTTLPAYDGSSELRYAAALESAPGDR